MSIDETQLIAEESVVVKKVAPEDDQTQTKEDTTAEQPLQPDTAEEPNGVLEDGKLETNGVSDEPASTKDEDPVEDHLNGVLKEVEHNANEYARAFLATHRREISDRDAEILQLKEQLAQTRHELETNVAALELSTSNKNEEKNSEPEAHVNGEASERLSGTPLSVLVEDNNEKILESIETIWNSLLEIVERTVYDDIPEDYLTKWSPDHLVATLGEKVVGVSLVEPLLANPTTAKRGRVLVVMAIMAQILEDYFLTPNYLLEDDDELRYILRAIRDEGRKQALRSLLLLTSEEDARKDTVIKKRVSNALDETLDLLEPLLPASTITSLRTDLGMGLEKVAKLWEPVQRSNSHYEVNTNPNRTPWNWKSISLSGENFTFIDIHSSSFGEGEKVMLLFPRVFALDRSKKPTFTPVYPGIVLQESQASVPQVDSAAEKEEHQDIPAGSTDGDNPVNEPTDPKAEPEAAAAALPEVPAVAEKASDGE